MALRVWVPFIDGTARDLGLAGLKFTFADSTKTSSNNSGKIGKCFYNNTLAAGGLLSTTNITLPVTQSWFCWAKFDLFYSSSSLTGVISQHDPTNKKNMGITVKYVSATTGYLSCSTGTGSSRTYNTYIGSTLLNTGIWYHLGFTYDGSTIKFYVNGVLDGTTSYSGQSQSAAPIRLFGWNIANSTYSMKGYLNDVRIYDNCLTPEEVKEISKGLVAHWTLDENSLNGPNLITSLISGGNCTVSGNNILVSGTNSDSYFQFNMSEAMVENRLYSISCWGAGFPNGSYYNFPIAAQSNSGPGVLKIKNGYCLLIFVANNTIANAGTRILMDDNGRVAGAGTISDLRLVKLNKSCDISGNHNDLIVNGNLTLSDNSVRYDKSYLFGSGISLTPLVPSFLTNEATVSMWVKLDQLPPSSPGRTMLYTTWLGFSCEVTSAGKTYFRTSLTSGTVDSPQGTITAGNWTHWVGVKSSTGVSLYLNGTLVGTASNSNNFNWSSGSNAIGAYSGSYWTYGKLSDIRLYATALSASDVQYLYSLGN